MLVILTQSLIVRVDEEEEAAEIAAAMTQKVDIELEGTDPRIVAPLGVLVQIVPDGIIE